jgi:serine/threonine protein kinase
MILESLTLSALDLGVARAFVLVLAALLCAGFVLGSRLTKEPAVTAVAKPGQLGPYVLKQNIGEGGMGVVYRAEHVLLRRRVALKLLRSSSNATSARFEREISLLAAIRHPNVVRLHDHGRTRDGTRYLAMELLDGSDLQTLVDREGAFEPGRVLSILLEVCAALADVHAKGFVHRDLKPANVFLCRGAVGVEQAKLIDFGLAKNFQSTDNPSLTGACIVGSPFSMAPECFTDPTSVGPRADLYSLGILAYTLLVGQAPFSSGNVIDVAVQHLFTAPAPVGERSPFGVSVELEAVIARCLSKSADERPASARALHALLLQCPEAELSEALRGAA